jgi:hypothetical protein
VSAVLEAAAPAPAGAAAPEPEPAGRRGGWNDATAACGLGLEGPDAAGAAPGAPAVSPARLEVGPPRAA